MKVVGIDRDFFQFMFTKLYQERWVGSQQLFAEEVNKRTGAAYKKTSVSRWLKGTLPSKDALSAICDILGVDETIFQPFSHPYAMRRYTSAFSDSFEIAMAKKAKDEYGIDLNFYEGLKNIIPDFGSRFPQNAPLIFCGSAIDPPYAREPHKERKKVKEKRLFQIEKDRKTIDLTDWDLKIIRLLQNKVSEIVVDWMDKTAAEMIADEKAVNLEFAARQSLLEDAPVYELSEEDLQRIDRYGLYTDEAKEELRPLKGRAFDLNNEMDLMELKRLAKQKKTGGNKDGKH